MTVMMVLYSQMHEIKQLQTCDSVSDTSDQVLVLRLVFDRAALICISMYIIMSYYNAQVMMHITNKSQMSTLVGFSP